MPSAPSRLARILVFALAASLLSLAAAYISQYGFGLTPCHLCIAQRVPYALIVVLAGLGIWKPRHQIWLICIIGLGFWVDSGIASYHFGVENHWIEGPSGCTNGDAPANQSMDDFLKRIQQAPIVACDQPQWEFHGITMAGLNAVWALFLGLATFAALQHSRKASVSDA